MMMSPPSNFGDLDIGNGGFADDHFPSPGSPQQQTPSESPQEEGPVEDEGQLLKDGNALIQRDLESRRKTREYSSRQVDDRKKKGDITKINLNFVDWSGFPAAAHSPKGIAERKRLSIKRASMDVSDHQDPSAGPPKLLSLRNLINREKEKEKDAADGKEDDTGIGSGGKRDNHQKYRNRRHSQRNITASNLPVLESPQQDRKRVNKPSERRKGQLDVGGSQHRAERRERRGSGLQRQRRMSNGNQPSSPTSRVRRPVAAAASSTTLEVSKKVPQRTASGMKRNSERRNSNEGGGLKHSSSGNLNETTGMKW